MEGVIEGVLDLEGVIEGVPDLERVPDLDGVPDLEGVTVELGDFDGVTDGVTEEVLVGVEV